MRGRPGARISLPALPEDVLSPQQREIAELAGEGLPVGAIARHLGTTVGAIKSQVHKIREKAVLQTEFDGRQPSLTVSIPGRQDVASGAEELRQAFRDHGRVAQLFSRAAGGPTFSDSGLADESPEVWHQRGRLIRVLAASGERDRAVVRVRSGERLATAVIRQGKVLYRVPDWDGGEELFVAVPRGVLSALQSGATA